jgi:ankyrin repeat protein
MCVRKVVRKVFLFHYLDIQNQMQMLNMLLQRPNVDINAQDYNGNTPLHWAIQTCKEDSEHKCVPVIQRLIAYAPINLLLKNMHGRTAIDEASFRGFANTVTMLKEYDRTYFYFSTLMYLQMQLIFPNMFQIA